jgi:hypothetical protein
MESAAHRIETIRKDIGVFQHRCDELIAQFEAAEDVVERTRLADEYGRALRQLESSQLLLSLVEKQGRMGAPAAGCD